MLLGKLPGPRRHPEFYVWSSSPMLACFEVARLELGDGGAFLTLAGGQVVRRGVACDAEESVSVCMHADTNDIKQVDIDRWILRKAQPYRGTVERQRSARTK